MSRVEVLPSALAETAHAVRSFSHEVDLMLPTASVDPVLAAAWDEYASRWSSAAADLADEAAACARSLATDAQEYAHVEALLVPRTLR